MAAGALMVARLLKPQCVPGPASDAEMMAELGADPEEAHQFRDGLLEWIRVETGLNVRVETHATTQKEFCQAVLKYLRKHPDATSVSDGGCTYSDDFRRFLLNLAGPGGLGEGMTTTELAYLTIVPVETWEEWLGSRASSLEPASRVP